MDRIAIRIVQATYGDDASIPAVEVEINGRTLEALVRGHGADATPMPAASVLWPGHLIWLGDEPRDDDLIEDGRTAVATCGCGVFGCGGVTARIEVGDTNVTWHDFAAANYGDALPVGPYRFDAQRYRRAILAVAEAYQRSGGRLR